ncbi:MAG: tetratricopeptide repeat protein, partial [Planctomycetota bacterium]|nr:tetratricopeptide repeat protein [Planctomycetota bacterium]
MEQPEQSLPVSGEGDVYEPSLCLDDDSLLGMTLSGVPDETSTPSPGASMHDWFNHGLAMLKSARWGSSRDAFFKVQSQIPSGDPLEARCYALRGYATAKLGRTDEAIEAYQDSIRIDDGAIEAWSGLACALLDQSQLQKALEAALQATQIRPENAPLRYNVGNILLRLEDYHGALAAFREAIKRDPGLYPAYVNLGVALAGQGAYAESIEQLDYAHILEPNARRVHTNRGIVLARLKRWDESAEALSRSIELSPKIGRTYIVLSIVERCRGNTLGAMSILNKCIDMDLEKPRAFHNLG